MVKYAIAFVFGFCFSLECMQSPRDLERPASTLSALNNKVVNALARYARAHQDLEVSQLIAHVFSNLLKRASDLKENPNIFYFLTCASAFGCDEQKAVMLMAYVMAHYEDFGLTQDDIVALCTCSFKFVPGESPVGGEHPNLLHVAIVAGNKSVVMILGKLYKGLLKPLVVVRVPYRDNQQFEVEKISPLALAALLGKIEIVEVLIGQLGVNINENLDTEFPWKTSAWRWMPPLGAAILHFAQSPFTMDQKLRRKYRKPLTWLLEHGAKIDAHGGWQFLCGCSSLAGQRKQIDYEFLLRMNLRDVLDEATGDLPLHFAARHGYDDLIKVFLKTVYVDTQNREGHTPLHIAAHAGQISTIQLLAQHGANLDQPLLHGEGTALHAACSDSLPGVIGALCAAGASMKVRNRAGKTPWLVLYDKRDNPLGRRAMEVFGQYDGRQPVIVKRRMSF